MRKLKNELWLSAPLPIVNAPLERVVFSATAQGRKASQINSQMAAVQCGAPSFIPHLQDSSMARPPTPLWCAADGQCFRTLVTGPMLPPPLELQLGFCSCHICCCCCSSRGCSCPCSQHSMFLPGWRQAEAFLLSSFICFSGVNSSCHLAAPQ